MIHLTGRYTVILRGDTDTLHKGGVDTSSIGYHFERLVAGKPTAINEELANFGLAVEVIDSEVEVPIIPQSEFAAVLDPTPEMIEAGWGVLDGEGIEAPPVETMVAVYRAMERAR